MGSEFTFVKIFWNEVEISQDKWDWQVADKKILTKTLKGMKLGIKLISSNHWGTEPISRFYHKSKKKGRQKRDSAPARDLTPEWSNTHGYSKDYYDFVSATVKRYSKSVKHWAIENEITYKMNYTGGLEKYNLILATAYKAVNNAQKDGIVINHGPSSGSYGEAIAFELFKSGKNKEAIEFYNVSAFPHRNTTRIEDTLELKEMFIQKNVRRKYKIILDGLRNGEKYDMYQLHCYDSVEQLEYILNWIEEKMKKYSNQKPIAAWEIGYYWKRNKTYNKIEHGKDIFKKIIILLSHDVKMITYFSIFGRSKKGDPWRGLYDNYFGKEKRPAAYVYENLINVLKDTVYEKKVRIDDNVICYRFRKGSKYLYFLWGKEKKGIKLPEYLMNSKLIDMYGNLLPSPKSDIIISDSPVYFFTQ
jgi:hypothetical protein